LLGAALLDSRGVVFFGRECRRGLDVRKQTRTWASVGNGPFLAYGAVWRCSFAAVSARFLLDSSCSVVFLFGLVLYPL
jgi:hypothetical protein